jgi:histidyl-tRNA synthetase
VAFTLILGDQELASGAVVARAMAEGQQTTVALTEVVAWLRTRV